MVAAKPLLATALIAVCFTGAALADNPTVRITRAGQAKAAGLLLRLSDLGSGWQGGATKPSPLVAPNCPGFNPKESDLVVSGHADARFTLPAEGVVLVQDVEVLASAAAVRTDFARTIRPQFPPCLAYELEHTRPRGQRHRREDPVPGDRRGERRLPGERRRPLALRPSR